MLKIGVLGAGHLGKIHLRLIKEIADYQLIGFYDPDPEAAKLVAKEFDTKAFDSIEDLIAVVDVVDIVTPTLSHYDCAVKSIRNSKHIFIEKPITNTVEEAKKLIELASEANVKVQVGHVERFNPAFTATAPFISQPMFIETHRLAQFNPRGTDVSVVLDLMIHDLDIVLSIVKSNVRKISASGVAVVSDTPDIANARIEFDNGCVANLTASRISLKNMRKTRIFQKDAYLSIDFLEKQTEVVRLSNVAEGEEDPLSVTIDLPDGKGKKQIYFEKPDVENNNAIKDELSSFAKSILNNTTPAVTIHDGYNALDVAHRIIERLDITKENIQVPQ
jgi:predicted dehydrogenase